MNEAEKMKRKMRSGAFRENNGRVLRALNILRHDFVSLRDVKYAVEEIPENQYLDSLNYLRESDYIHLRNIETGELVQFGLADMDYKDLEAKLTKNGIKLLSFSIKDEDVVI